jgi:hypothetical protein
MLSRSSPSSSIKARLASSTFWRRSVGFLIAINYLASGLDTVKVIPIY